MGALAIYVIVDNTGWRRYFSRWGAEELDAYLSCGWQVAVEIIESRDRDESVSDDPASAWPADDWCEGAVLVDLRRRHLMFFDASQYMPLLHYRRAYFALLERMWPGWTVQWAYRGLPQLAAYLQVDFTAADALTPGDARLDISELTRATESDLAGGSFYWTLVTVRGADGRVRAHAVEGGGLHPVAFGRQLEAVIPFGLGLE